MPKAKVKWFNDSKGYGYLTLEDGQDVFCHYTQIDMSGFKSLVAGEEVTLDLYEEQTLQGSPVLVARNVRRSE